MNKIICVKLIFIIIVLCSCTTSSRKNTGDVYSLRIFAENGLETANKEAGKGNFIMAHSLLVEYKRLAILTDDPSLIIRLCLSLGNVLFSHGRTEEAFSEWEQAVLEAEKINNRELLSISRIFRARGNLVSGRASALSVLEEVTRESANIKTDPFFVAFSWQVRGLAHRSMGSFREAEDAMRRSLDIHLKERSLENASYDWYTIASIRSLAGNTQGALTALETSITIDRRIENSFGIAASYRAMGDVHRKTGREEEAQNAYRRARAIFSAMGNNDEVLEIDRRIRASN
jgi:tetratricopeptide (TPR) repeat protein